MHYSLTSYFVQIEHGKCIECKLIMLFTILHEWLWIGSFLVTITQISVQASGFNQLQRLFRQFSQQSQQKPTKIPRINDVSDLSILQNWIKQRQRQISIIQGRFQLKCKKKTANSKIVVAMPSPVISFPGNDIGHRLAWPSEYLPPHIMINTFYCDCMKCGWSMSRRPIRNENNLTI